MVRVIGNIHVDGLVQDCSNPSACDLATTRAKSSKKKHRVAMYLQKYVEWL